MKSISDFAFANAVTERKKKKNGGIYAIIALDHHRKEQKSSQTSLQHCLIFHFLLWSAISKGQGHFFDVVLANQRPCFEPYVVCFVLKDDRLHYDGVKQA